MNMQEKMRRKAAKLTNPTPVELPSGRWRCQVMVNGKRVSVVDEDPSVAHASALAQKAGIIQADALKKENSKTNSLTLRDAITQYIELKEDVLSPATVRGYKIMQRNRFQELMDRNIYSLAKDEIQRAISQETRKVSAKTVYNAYGLIRPVLREYDIDVFGLKLPQKIKPKKKYLQPEDIGKLLEAAQGDSCEAAIIMAAWLGMRRSEIIGLCWDCVDFERKTISIRRTVVPNKNNQFILKEGAKNEASQRTISCPDYLMDMLKRMYSPGQSGQVFTMHPDTLRKHIHAICAKAGLTDTTVHGLRHTNAAVMKYLGIDDRHAMARGGWTNESTYKQTYSYVFDHAEQAADQEINRYFEELHTNLHTKK